MSSTKKRKVETSEDVSKKAKHLSYLAGFGNLHESSALPSALPVGQNNPQRCPYGLYAEQLSGSAFTKQPRSKNLKSWLYRIQPSVQHSKFVNVDEEFPDYVTNFHGTDTKADPNQMRWMPIEAPKDKQIDFLHGLKTMGGNGEPSTKDGFAIHMYVTNTNMGNTCLTNADGDYLLVPQEGGLIVTTEFGILEVEPKEIVVVQRGMRFSVDLMNPETPCRGYILELFAKHFELPELGPIGANGLANPQDFLTPTAKYQKPPEEQTNFSFTCYTKFGGRIFKTLQKFSPFNVVAWRGNYVPYKYDLSRFCCMNSVTYDHPDPSIYTVLTCQSDDPGTAVCDFVIFPPRWMVMEHSFRPPYYHRNTMSEFMGMIWGVYDAKSDTDGKSKGFVPGGASLHSCMTPHGPDAKTFLKASDPKKGDLKPHFFDKGLAFMFETSVMMKLTKFALEGAHRDFEYQKCWESLPALFNEQEKVHQDQKTSHILGWRNQE